MKSKYDYSNQNNGSWLFFLFFWIFAAILISIPSINTFNFKLAILLPVVIITLFATLIKPRFLFPFWAIIMGFLVLETGFQLEIKQITISALELIIIVLLLIILLYTNNPNLDIRLDIPGQRYFNIFIYYSLTIYVITIILGIDPLAAIAEMKGFILYPLMIYFFLLGIHSKKILLWAIIFPLIFLLVIASNGIINYQNGVNLGEIAIRADGNYAPINIYGITLASFSLCFLGISSHFEGIKKFGFIIISLWLLGGALTSVSRVVWLMYAIGLLFLLIIDKKSWPIVFVMLTAVTLITSINPGNITWRIFQTSDSSSVRRILYLESGWQAFKKYWLFGAGWGNGQAYYPGIGVVSSGSIPWYHNDYLNLAVQTGIIGLGLYIGYWFSLLKSSITEVRKYANSFENSVAKGSMAGLVSLLVAAGFEHVLWRPDVAGVVGWMSGIMLSSIYLNKDDQKSLNV